MSTSYLLYVIKESYLYLNSRLGCSN